MKVKVKFDLAAMKRWLVDNGEKLAFGVMVLVFLLFTYAALNREVLDATKQPDKLKSMADSVTAHLTKTPWDENSSGLKIVNYEQRAKRDPVDGAAFAARTPLNPLIVDQKGKREDPELFNIEEPRVTAGYGTFALKDAGSAAGGAARAPAAGGGKAAGGNRARGAATAFKGRGVKPTGSSKLKGQPWAVITALVPSEKQAGEFERIFAHSIGEQGDRDKPHYYGVMVERAEVDNANPDKLDWAPLDFSVAQAFEDQWEAGVEEIIPGNYVDPNLTFALGPLVGVDWGRSVVHPKVPLAKESEAQELASEAAPAAAEKEPEKPPAAGNQGVRHRATAIAVPQAPAPGVAKNAKTPPRYLMLRVFDYSVEPNKQYRYRFKLGMENPNYKLAAKFLKRPDAPSNNEQVRWCANWSEPTDPVTVPDSHGLLAGVVEQPKTASGEPTAKVMLLAIKQEDGITASTEVKVPRGGVANKKDKVAATDPRTGDATDPSEVDFKTNLVVLDMFGGKSVSLPKRKESPYTAPSEVVLMDRNGILSLRTEFDDAVQYEFRKPPEDAPRKSDKDSSLTDDAKPAKKPRREPRTKN